VFGSAAKPKSNGEEEEGDEDVAADYVDIHFEPIVSLPEVPGVLLILNCNKLAMNDLQCVLENA